MALINSDVIPASAPAVAYEIGQSLRANESDTPKLTRTPSSAGNRKTFTFSFWVKKCTNDEYNAVITAGSTSNVFYIMFQNDDTLTLMTYQSTTPKYITTAAKYRDPAAWLHVTAVVDTTQSDAGERQRLYVNGERITTFTSNVQISQNIDVMHINNASLHTIFNNSTSVRGLDGYLAEFHFIDGQALEPSNFGETGTYGQWQPIEYTGSYGTNGYYLDFSNASDFGEDFSGNNNDWTQSNLSTYDKVLDSPTNNFATLNYNWQYESHTVSEGNLKIINGSSQSESVSTISMSSGKWYAECNFATKGSNHAFGIRAIDRSAAIIIDSYDGSIYTVGGSGTAPTTGIIGIAVDADAKTVKVYDDNSLILSSTSYSSFTETDVVFSIAKTSTAGSDTIIANFGQDGTFAGTKTAQGNTDDNGYGDFYYAPPSGYLALCTANLSDPAVIPSENFNTVLYTGDGTSSRSITGVGFTPDWVWIKIRNTTGAHFVYDTVRGVQKGLHTNLTDAETTYTNGLLSFDSDGFTVGNRSNQNGSGNTFVSWNWNANGSGSSNTNGSITSTVSANQDAGFSIVKYTGNTSYTQTVGHGLSSAPEMMIFKNLDSTYDWVVYHKSLGATKYLILNSTATVGTSSTPFGNTEPTSSVFTVSRNGGNSWRSTNGEASDYIAYCFHSVEGFSKVGSYTGNGSSDGTFVYTGFRPAFVIIKKTTGSSWHLIDSKRPGYNEDNEVLVANIADAAQTNYSVQERDLLSNGFKMRDANSGTNQSGITFIYIAFAEVPFSVGGGIAR